LIITVDGPGSSGKGTITKRIAKKLGYVYLDTGAMYRCLTYYCLSQPIDIWDEVAVSNALANIDIAFDKDGTVYLNGEDVSEAIRTDEISAMTSDPISTYRVVREGIVEKERVIAAEADNIIVDGRDSGSVVFPEADIKLFISASLAERAKRRAQQNEGLGQNTDPRVIADELARRDQSDIMRASSPLVIPRGAIVVDTTNMSVEQTLAHIYAIINDRII